MFDAFHHSESEEQKLFTSYLVNWVAGVKLIFIFLLAVILLVGTETLRMWGGGSDDSVDCHLLLAAASYHQKIGCHGMYHAQRLFQSIGLDDFRLYGDVYSCN